jgi:hypothetical protein
MASVLETGKSKKNVVRAVRLTDEQESSLRQDAEGRGITPGTLISLIISKYLDWDRYLEKYGVVTLAPSTLKQFLDGNDEEHVRAAGAHAGRILLERTMFQHKQINLQVIMEMIGNLCRYGQLAKFDSGVQGDDYVITLRHDWGAKWSFFLEECVKTALRESLGVDPLVERSDSSVDVRFHKLSTAE